MNTWEAILLGIIQGLTEFLPISSSGHLELGNIILGLEESSLSFAIVVHGATVLSTIVILFNEIARLFKGIFPLKWNESNKYILKLLVSTIPVIFVGFLLEEKIEGLFSGNLIFVGSMLLITAFLLLFTYWARPKSKKISFFDALIIGVAQAFAVIPGISRSGSTIATGLILGNKKEDVAKFSFLMVLIPIIGANLLDLISGDFGKNPGISAEVLIAGFIAAFITGLFACKWMLNLVKKGKLYYFAIYCAIIGSIAIIIGRF